MRTNTLGAKLGAALALALCFHGGGAFAQEGVPEEAGEDQAAVKAQAKERFLRGLALMRLQDWAGALAELDASLELFPAKVALQNRAACLQHLDRPVEALETCQRLLAQFGDKLSDAERQAIGEATSKLSARVGELELHSNPSGAVVIVDGVERGKTPLAAPIRVRTGEHQIRVFKEGFYPHQVVVGVAGGEKKSIVAELRALTASGRLRVVEASEATVDVVVDGAVVGQTPWEGTLAAGPHAVWLRGQGGVGTAPSAAPVATGRLQTLSLRAVRLESEIRISVVPSNAELYLDGVALGAGAWQGKLGKGRHTVEATAEGFLPAKRSVTLAAGKAEDIQLELERDLSDPRWGPRFSPHLYFELTGGGFFAPSFGGSADAACSSGDCTERSRPLGFLVGGRAGYQVIPGLGLELFLGYLQARSSMTREQTATSDAPNPLRSTRDDDRTRLSGPLAALSASYQLFDQTPLSFRIWAGIGRFTARFDNDGRFVVDSADTQYQPREVDISIAERDETVWVPLLGPEVRFGYRFSERLMLDGGVAFWYALAGDALRTGKRTQDSDGERSTDLIDTGGVPGALPLGRTRLPREKGFSSFWSIVPTVAVRYDL